ncbi:MAG: nitroreductase/dihydropteridine reductase [Parvicella sp.]|jgi:nitroreductase/dihydropteridine reductase
MNYIDALNWRYATKKFHGDRIIEEDALERILESGNLTATSLGLQAVTIINVEDKAIRKDLVASSYNQSQVADASNLLVICIEENISEEYLNTYLSRISTIRNMEVENLEGFKKMIQGWLGGLSDVTNMQHWLAKQAYIVLGTLLTTCAIEKIDSCPMEGFNAEQYTDKLKLKEKGLVPVVVLPIGYRAMDDVNQHLPKVRKTAEEFVITI